MSISQFALYVGDKMSKILVTKDDGQTFRKYDPKEIKRSILYTYQFLKRPSYQGFSATISDVMPEDEINKIIERVNVQVENYAEDTDDRGTKVIYSDDLHFIIARQLMMNKYKEIAYWFIRKVGDF